MTRILWAEPNLLMAPTDGPVPQKSCSGKRGVTVRRLRSDLLEPRLANYGFAIGRWLLNDELSNN